MKKILFAALAVFCLFSCKKKEKKDENADPSENYFSIRQFALDEWNTYSGTPLTIIKTVRVGKGKTDSSFTNTDTINWVPIFKAFFDADISDHKFVGKYKYSHFEDNDGSIDMLYETLDPDQFTQKLLVTVDEQTMKVTGIYAETFRHGFFSDVTQKLYYNPLTTIQIQTDEQPKIGSRKYSVVQYDFMR